MFKPYHDDNPSPISNIKPNSLIPVEAIANFNREGEFRVEYIRFELESQERVTLKMKKLIRQLNKKDCVIHEYECINNQIKKMIRLYYFIGDSTFYIEND